MKVSLFVFVVALAGARAMDGYGAPPPPPEITDPVPPPPAEPTTGAPCDPVDESVPEECLETDPNTGCQVALPDCPAPVAETPMPVDPEAAGYEGPATDAPAVEATETAEPAAPTEGPEEVEETATTAEPASEIDATPEPASEPEATPEPASEPEATPEPAPEPEATPAPGSEPEGTPAPEDEPAPEEEMERSSSQTDELPEEGQDIDQYCCFWAQQGECTSNAYWMKPRCQKSCGTPGCSVDALQNCPAILNVEGCQWPVEGYTPGSLDEPQEPEGPPPPEGCMNKHRLCDFWQEAGECENNAQWMAPNCPISCGAC